MKTIFTLLILFSSVFAQAQKWAPLGMTWNYFRIGEIYDPKDSYVLTFQASDTITINGHFCTVIKPLGFVTDTVEMGTSLITYEDSGKVYWYSPVLEDFTILYDFTKNVGESWTINGMLDDRLYSAIKCSLVVTVKAVDIDTINGIPLKKMKVTSNYRAIFDGEILEGIGHTTRPRPWLSMMSRCGSFITDYAYDYFGLYCIDNGTIGFHDFKIGLDCKTPLHLIESQKSKTPIYVYPTPSNGVVNISFGEWIAKDNQDVNVIVYDMMGRIFLQKKINASERNTSLNIEVNGSYIIEVSAKNITPYRKYIIIAQ